MGRHHGLKGFFDRSSGGGLFLWPCYSWHLYASDHMRMKGPEGYRPELAGESEPKPEVPRATAEKPEADKEQGETPEQARVRELQEKNERQSIAIEAIRKDYEELKKAGFENIDDQANAFSHVTGTLLNHAKGYRELFAEDMAAGEGDPDDLAKAERSTAGLDKYLTFFAQNRDKFFATSRTAQGAEALQKIRSTFDAPEKPTYQEDIDALLKEYGSQGSGQ